MSSRDTSTISETLPMGWTQVQRACCEDQSCRRHRPRSFVRDTTSDDIVSSTHNNTVLLQGQAMFCWHEIDPSWFQGYFLCRGRIPIGILAEQTEVDECLECADGGYHELKLKFSNISPGKVGFTLQDVTWTGGDMMQLQSEDIEFETERFISGKAAVAVMEKHFGSLVKRLHEVDGDDETILELIPDVAVLVGTMKLRVPRSALELSS